MLRSGGSLTVEFGGCKALLRKSMRARSVCPPPLVSRMNGILCWLRCANVKGAAGVMGRLDCINTPSMSNAKAIGALRMGGAAVVYVRLNSERCLVCSLSMFLVVPVLQTVR